MERLDDADVRNEVLVAELNEEEWGVASFLDLVVRILKALADQAPSLSARIDTTCDRFSKVPDEAEACAVGLLREHAQGKTPMLFCENLLDLFGGLGDEGQRKWRSVMQEDSNWTIVASTPSLFAALALQDNPFYGLFTIRQLERLDFEAALELLAKKAVHESRPGLAGFLRTSLGRPGREPSIIWQAATIVPTSSCSTCLTRNRRTTSRRRSCRWLTALRPAARTGCASCRRPSARSPSSCLGKTLPPRSSISVPSLMSRQPDAKQVGELDSAGFVRRQ